MPATEGKDKQMDGNTSTNTDTTSNHQEAKELVKKLSFDNKSTASSDDFIPIPSPQQQEKVAANTNMSSSRGGEEEEKVEETAPTEGTTSPISDQEQPSTSSKVVTPEAPTEGTIITKADNDNDNNDKEQSTNNEQEDNKENDVLNTSKDSSILKQVATSVQIVLPKIAPVPWKYFFILSCLVVIPSAIYIIFFTVSISIVAYVRRYSRAVGKLNYFFGNNSHRFIVIGK